MATYQLKGGHKTTDPRLDRIPQFDERSKNFRAAPLFGATLPTVKYVWQVYKWLDQGSEGACVGFSFTNDANAIPIRHYRDNAYARMWYHRAQQLDQWPGENYDGTSVLAGAQTGQELGYFLAYRWAFSVEEAAAALVSGPAIFGINWYNTMFTPKGKLYVVSPAGGEVAGGHAIMLRGFYPAGSSIWIPTTNRTYTVPEPMLRLRNSWGQDWGMNGDCLITVKDMRTLMSEDGDCCVPINRMKVV